MFNDSSISEKNSETKGSITRDGCLKGHFCSKTDFNLSELECWLEKNYDFPPIQKTLNETELRKDFEEFFHRMRLSGIFKMNQLIVSVKHQL